MKPPTRLQLVKALLSRGYFPKELPPPFQTTRFASVISKLAKAWDSHIATLPQKERDRSPRPSVPCNFDLARRGHARRVLSLVNPVNQYYLASAVADHYQEINDFCDKARFSLTKARIDLAAERSVPLPPFADLAETRLKAYAIRGHILSTDIGSFYHSMYTHSIPWALHGKNAAKKVRSRANPKFWGNELDFLIRQCQDGQTKGIPVGPDTSRILSEIILSAIDQQVDLDIGAKIAAGYRYIDDIFYCFSLRQDAEATLSRLREAARHFELELNPSKTALQPALSFNEETWPHKLAAMRIRSGGKSQRISLFAFFSSMIEIAASQANESIAVYAIKASTTHHINRENWDIYEAFLLRISREHTNAVDLATKVLCTYAAIGYPISPLVGEWVNDLVIAHTPASRHFEVAWALWAAISLKVKLSKEAVATISKTDNSVCALLALHAQKLKLCSEPLDSATWFASPSAEEFYESRWLLLYESIRQGWFSTPPAALTSEPFFQELLRHKVGFYLTTVRNLPVDIPYVQHHLRNYGRENKKDLLPGNIYFPRKRAFETLRVERMRGNYGEDDESDEYDADEPF